MSEEKIVYFVQRRVENLRNHPGMVFYIGHQVPGPIRALTHQRETSFLRASAISSAGSDGMNVGTPSSANPALIPSDNRPPLRNVNTENLRQASVKEEELKSAEFKMEEQKENVEGTSVGMCSRFKRRLSCSSDESSICSQETVQVKKDEDTASVTDSDDERGETKEISVGELSIDDEQEESLRVASESPKESTRISLSSLSMRRKESDVLQSEDRDQLEEANTHWVDALESLDRINLLLGNVTPETGKENAKTDSPSDVTEKSGNKQGDRSLPFVVGPNCDISINKPETVTEESSIILSSDHIHDSSHSIERTETQLSESVLIPTTVLTSTNATSEKAPCGEPANDIPRAEDFTSPVLAASNLPDQEEGEAESGPVLPNETNSSLEMIDESDKGKCNDDSGILDSENLVPDPVPDSVAERMNDDRGSDESSGTMTAREDGKENISDEVVCIAEAETVASNKQSNAEAAENGNKDVRKEALTEVEIADALNVIADLVEKISNSIDANPVETGDDQKTSKSTDPENDSLESPEVELAQCVVLSETVPDGLEDTAGKTSDQFLETTTVEKDVLDGKSNESAPKKDEVASESPAGSSKTSFDSGREKSTPRKNAPSVGRVVAKKASVLLVDTIPIEADRKKQSGVDKVSESTERIRGFSVRQSVADTKHSSLKKTKPASLEIDEKRTQPKEDLQRNPVQRPRSRDDSDSSLKRKSIKERRRRTYDGRKTVDTHKSAERSVTDQSSIRKHHTSRDGDADKELQKHTSGQERKRGSISSDEKLTGPMKIPARRGNLAPFLKLMREKSKTESSVSNASDVESNTPSSSSTGGCEVSETKITDSTEVLDQTLQETHPPSHKMTRLAKDQNVADDGSIPTTTKIVTTESTVPMKNTGTTGIGKKVNGSGPTGKSSGKLRMMTLAKFVLRKRLNSTVSAEDPPERKVSRFRLIDGSQPRAVSKEKKDGPGSIRQRLLEIKKEGRVLPTRRRPLNAKKDDGRVRRPSPMTLNDSSSPSTDLRENRKKVAERARSTCHIVGGVEKSDGGRTNVSRDHLSAAKQLQNLDVGSRLSAAKQLRHRRKPPHNHNLSLRSLTPKNRSGCVRNS